MTARSPTPAGLLCGVTARRMVPRAHVRRALGAERTLAKTFGPISVN